MRIGINIPNELMKRLEPLKPELNISQVCREALAAKADKYETAISSLGGVQTETALELANAEEIRRRSIIEVDWERLGYVDAVAWVKAAEWKDWRSWNNRREWLKRQDRPLWDGMPHISRAGKWEKVKDFWERWTDFTSLISEQSDDFLDWLYDDDLYPDQESAQREYGEAWLTYTEEAWRLIQQRREEHYETLRQKRITERRNRPDPEIPEHLLEGRQ